jgi:hypothetical protein
MLLLFILTAYFFHKLLLCSLYFRWTLPSLMYYRFHAIYFNPTNLAFDRAGLVCVLLSTTQSERVTAWKTTACVFVWHKGFVVNAFTSPQCVTNHVTIRVLTSPPKPGCERVTTWKTIECVLTSPPKPGVWKSDNMRNNRVCSLVHPNQECERVTTWKTIECPLVHPSGVWKSDMKNDRVCAH